MRFGAARRGRRSQILRAAGRAGAVRRDRGARASNDFLGQPVGRESFMETDEPGEDFRPMEPGRFDLPSEPASPRGPADYGAPRVGRPGPVPPAMRDDAADEGAPSSGAGESSGRDASGELPDNLLVGRNPIREAIKAGRGLEKLLVMRGDLSGSAREIVAKGARGGRGRTGGRPLATGCDLRESPGHGGLRVGGRVRGDVRCVRAGRGKRRKALRGGAGRHHRPAQPGCDPAHRRVLRRARRDLARAALGGG